VGPLLERRVFFRASVFLLLVASYLPVFTLYAKQHWSSSNLQGTYAHAPLTVLLILFLVWRQRSNLTGPKPATLPLSGLVLLLGGVVLKVYGDIHGYDVLQGMSLIPVLLGLSRLYCGTNAVNALRFPVLFLFFIIPLPGAAIDAITLPLVNATASLITGLLPLFSIEVAKTGHVLTVNAVGLPDFHEIILAPECSGIRSFVSLIALSSVFAHLQGRNSVHATILLLTTIPLVILGNCIRVALTVIMIVYIAPETAENFFHLTSGFLLFAVTLLGLFVADTAIKRWLPERLSGNA